MRPMKHRVISLNYVSNRKLLKIAPYHMPKFGRYQKSSYLCTGNRKEQSFVPRSSLLLRPTRVINDDRRRSSMKTPKTAETGRSGEFEPTRLVSYPTHNKKKPPMQKSTGSLRKQIIIILKRSIEYAAHHSTHHDAPSERPK